MKFDGQKYFFWTLIVALAWTALVVFRYGGSMPTWAIIASVILFVGTMVANLTDKSVLGVDPPKSYFFIGLPLLSFATILIGISNYSVIK